MNNNRTCVCRDRKADREREREAEKYWKKHKDIIIQDKKARKDRDYNVDITEAEAESVSQSDRQTYRKTHRHTERQTHIQKDRQTENV